MLDRIHEQKLDANVSVKLTQMGLDIDEELCVEIMQPILHARARLRHLRAPRHGGERVHGAHPASSSRTGSIPNYRENVGIVLQSYLYRTSADVERAIALKCARAPVQGRLQGAGERSRIPTRRTWTRTTCAAWRSCCATAIIPGIATHDRRSSRARRRSRRRRESRRRASSSRCSTACAATCRTQLVREGYRMRVYVPFGTQWYPYLMRRLAERPANVAFITGNVVREMMRRLQTVDGSTRAARSQPRRREHARRLHGGARATGGLRGRRWAIVHRRDRDGRDGGARRARSARYLLFVRWGGEQPVVTGHLETPFLAWGATAEDAAQAVGALSLHEVKRQLDLLIGCAGSASRAPGGTAMRDEGSDREP